MPINGLKQWIAQQVGTEDFHFYPLSGDASFRSYYRVEKGNLSYIAMLAPPEKERTDAFVNIARSWRQYGINVPLVWGWEEKQGFVLLSDFGDTLLLDRLSSQTVDNYYQQAMKTLLLLQRSHSQAYPLPLFDETHIRQELFLFQDWFLEKLLQISLTAAEHAIVEAVFHQLIQCCLSQPQVIIHRDYHSRNLMVLTEELLGIIDFQDAMVGPITYDLVSLLKDCYISWPRDKVEAWVKSFYDMLRQEKQLPPIEFSSFIQWFDWVGLQRHLKVLGIFSRLKLRDNKPRYLGDMPRIMNYVLQVTAQSSELEAFYGLLTDKVLPRLQALWQEEKIDPTVKVA